MARQRWRTAWRVAAGCVRAAVGIGGDGRETKGWERGSYSLDVDPTVVVVCTNFKYWELIVK